MTSMKPNQEKIAELKEAEAAVKAATDFDSLREAVLDFMDLFYCHTHSYASETGIDHCRFSSRTDSPMY